MALACSKISILGGGLLGGSIAMAVKEKGIECMVWGRSEKSVQEVITHCGVSATMDVEEVITGSDLVVLATPVGVMEDLFLLIKRNGYKGVVTDVGSVKRVPHAVSHRVFSSPNLPEITFVGSHPMAGSEKKGCQSARPDLFLQAACVVTSDEENLATEEVSFVTQFWKELGCRVFQMTPEEHDEKVARVSHFPHVLASVCAQVGLSFEQASELSGGGMRDTSRVAAGDPSMWAEILVENADGLEVPLRESIEVLTQIVSFLEQGEKKAIEKFLRQAKVRRDQFI